MPRSSGAALAAPVLTLALLGLGCSERADRPAAVVDAPAASPADIVTDDVMADLRSAGDIAMEAGSARFEATLALEVLPPEGDPDGAPIVVELVTTGAFSARRLEMATDLGSALRSVDPEAPLPPGFDEPMRTIFDGATTYLRLPALDELLGTRAWVVVAPAELAALEELPDTATGPGVGGVDPIALLNVLRDVREVELVGDEWLGGAPVRHVRTEVDVTSALGPDDGSAVIVPVDVWIDDAGLVHRLEVDLGEAPELLGALGRLASASDATGVAGSATMTLKLSDHGTDIEVALPSPDDVVPVADAIAAVEDVLGRSGRGGR